MRGRGVEVSKTLFCLKVLKEKGIERKGKLEFVEKNKTDKKIVIVELGREEEAKLSEYINEIELLLEDNEIPDRLDKPKCKKCAYYEYCYI